MNFPAYITFDSFATDHSMTAEDYYKVDDPADFADTNTIGLIIKAHAMAIRGYIIATRSYSIRYSVS